MMFVKYWRRSMRLIERSKRDNHITNKLYQFGGAVNENFANIG